MHFRNLFLALLLVCCSVESQAKNRYALVPQPSELIPENGIFKITSATKILIGTDLEEIKKTGELLSETIFRASGMQLPVEIIPSVTGQVNTIGFFLEA